MGPARCKTCLDPTPYHSTGLCNRCWEVESRIAGYLRSANGRALVSTELASASAKLDICNGNHSGGTVHSLPCALATIARKDKTIADQHRRILAVSEVLADAPPQDRNGTHERIACALAGPEPWARDAEHARVVSGTEPLNSAARDQRPSEPPEGA